MGGRAFVTGQLVGPIARVLGIVSPPLKLNYKVVWLANATSFRCYLANIQMYALMFDARISAIDDS